MAETILWKSTDMDIVPKNQLVIVYGTFYGYALRSFDLNGGIYDENEIYDDSGIEWDLWTELPPKPGPE